LIGWGLSRMREHNTGHYDWQYNGPQTAAMNPSDTNRSRPATTRTGDSDRKGRIRHGMISRDLAKQRQGRKPQRNQQASGRTDTATRDGSRKFQI